MVRVLGVMEGWGWSGVGGAINDQSSFLGRLVQEYVHGQVNEDGRDVLCLTELAVRVSRCLWQRAPICMIGSHCGTDCDLFHFLVSLITN